MAITHPKPDTIAGERQKDHDDDEDDIDFDGDLDRSDATKSLVKMTMPMVRTLT